MSKVAEVNLKVVGWTSEFASVQKCLDHYARKTKAEHTRRNVVEALNKFFLHVGSANPDEYVRGKKKGRIESDFQSFLDSMRRLDLSIRYINATFHYVNTFFEVNGWKNGKALEVERYHQPARYRKKLEYIPTLKEAWAIVENAGELKYRAAIASIITGGFRNSTLRALLYRDIKEELENPKLQAIKFPVYPEMKKIDQDACKNSIPYYSFSYVAEMLRTLAQEIKQQYGEFPDEAPFFVGERINGTFSPMSDKSLQRAVKRGARLAGIKRWQDVTPKALRVVFQNILKSQFADGSGRMDEKDQEFLMGHILPGSQDSYFDSSKVEELRSQYLKLKFKEEPRELTVEEREKLQSFDELKSRVSELQHTIDFAAKQNMMREIRTLFKRYFDASSKQEKLVYKSILMTNLGLSDKEIGEIERLHQAFYEQFMIPNDSKSKQEYLREQFSKIAQEPSKKDIFTEYWKKIAEATDRTYENLRSQVEKKMKERRDYSPSPIDYFEFASENISDLLP